MGKGIMSLELQLEISLLVLLAAALSALIGFNREMRNRPAGLRTHMLVGIGSCLFTLLSIYGFADGDPGRVASQILPGLGFLGAGAILKERGNIEGLTTAASMWATASIGMAVGIGAWLLAMLATLIVWFVLAVLARAEPEDLK
jgi:putative Mg2+ transporter-C (MgtC) family protein